MIHPQRLWRALERVPGLATVPAEWKALLGPEHDAAQALLRPTGRLAASVPCPAVPACGCHHAVITHAPDDIVSVCRCEPRRCDTAPLGRADIVIYEVDRRKLGVAVASALDAEVGWEPVDGLPMTWRIGTASLDRNDRLPLYLTVQIEPDDLRRVVGELAAANISSFLLVAPTRDLLSPASEALLEKRNAWLLPLADLLVWNDKGLLAAAQPPHKTLDEIRVKLRGGALPPADLAAYCRVVTREGARSIDADEYKALVGGASEFDMFIDGMTGTVLRRYDGTAMQPEHLTAGEFAMIAEYLESRKIMRPSGTKAGAGKTPKTAKRLFNAARGKVDVRLARYRWWLFRLHKSTERDMAAFEFAPPDGVTYCLIVPVQP